LDWVDRELQVCLTLINEFPQGDADRYELNLSPVSERTKIRMANPRIVAGGFRFQLEYDRIMQLLMDIRKRGTAVMMITHNHALLDEYPASLVLTCEDNCVKNITPQNIEININTNNTAEINPIVF
jgi:hypothetical protein